jgi:hypothetical protein
MIARLAPIALLLPLLFGYTGCELPAAADELDDPTTPLEPGDPDLADWAAWCAPVQPVRCGDQVSGDTSDWNDGATDVLDHYPIAVGDWSGPEIAYVFDAGPGQEVSFTLIDPVPMDVNHDLFVLDASMGCHNGAAVARGFNEVTFEAEMGRRYYLVVDGYAGDAGRFDARLDCGEADYDGGVGDPEPEPEPGDDGEVAPEDCLFGTSTWVTQAAGVTEWTAMVASYPTPDSMSDLVRAQLDVGWNAEHEGSGIDAVWDIADSDGVWVDRIDRPATDESFDWVRFRSGTIPHGFFFRAGSTNLVAYDVDTEIRGCTVAAPTS